jgi:hypothetical protein
MTYTDPRRKFDATKRFVLLPTHLTLLENAYVQWQDTETGAPEIDPKRPYGNSDVPYDVAEILKVDDPVGDEDAAELLLDLHRETELALQVVLQTRSFVPGIYGRDSYATKWFLVAAS